jgi:hypothetical protein
MTAAVGKHLENWLADFIDMNQGQVCCQLCHCCLHPPRNRRSHHAGAENAEAFANLQPASFHHLISCAELARQFVHRYPQVNHMKMREFRAAWIAFHDARVWPEGGTVRGVILCRKCHFRPGLALALREKGIY